MDRLELLQEHPGIGGVYGGAPIHHRGRPCLLRGRHNIGHTCSQSLPELGALAAQGQGVDEVGDGCEDCLVAAPVLAQDSLVGRGLDRLQRRQRLSDLLKHLLLLLARAQGLLRRLHELAAGQGAHQCPGQTLSVECELLQGVGNLVA